MDFWTFPNVSAPYLRNKALLRKLQLLSPTSSGGTRLEYAADSSQHPGAGLEPRTLVLIPAVWCKANHPSLPALACAAGSGPRCKADTQKRCVL